MLWTKKYAPKNAQEVQGQDKAVSHLRDYISNYKKQKKKAAVVDKEKEKKLDRQKRT